MKKTITVMRCIVFALVLLIGGMLLYVHCNKDNRADWQKQYDLGVRCLSEEKYQEAVLMLAAAIDADPARYEAYLAQGDAYMGLEQYEDALLTYQRAYELAPDDLTGASQKLEIAQKTIDEQNQEASEATEEIVLDTVVTETEPVVLVSEEKKISAITSLYNGGISTKEVFYYDNSGNLIQRITTGYSDGQQTYTYGTEYLYDGAGMLQSRKEIGSQFAEYEYHYDRGVLTGYTYNEVMGDVVAISTTYHYERDTDGNIVKISTTGTIEDVWTNGEYTYDSEGRCVSAHEHERYGDHEFERNMSYDYSNKGAVIVTKEETMFGFTDTSRMIQFGSMEYGYITGSQLCDGYSIVRGQHN